MGQLFRRVGAGALALGSVVAVAPMATGALAEDTCPAPAPMTFEQEYIDTTRAGGEPIMTLHPDGNLLWGSHAGTTHFFALSAAEAGTAAFLQNYQGQTYYYYSTDDGETWTFVPRLPIVGGEGATGVPMSGFSDPEFAIDAAGNVFISEINLANIAVSKSTDGGRSYVLQNVLGAALTDRQWMVADTEDVLYMTGNAMGGPASGAFGDFTGGHFLAKSTDGGVTFTAGTPNPNGAGDIHINTETGDVYELGVTGSSISMIIYRGIRDATDDFESTVEEHLIVEGLSLDGIEQLIAVTFDMDDEGNLYVVWPDRGATGNEPGIYYAYSTDDGATWSWDPIRVSLGEGTAIWPWVTAGDPGNASIVWLQTERALPGHDAEAATEADAWQVMHAASLNALGCEDSEIPGFNVQQASDPAPHMGSICVGGTACQAQAIDRRLGDYFDNEINAKGEVVIAVSDTNQGGAVSLPLRIRQTSGPLLAGAGAAEEPEAGAAGTPEDAPADPAPAEEPPTRVLPATGGGFALMAFGLALLAINRRR